MDNQLTEIQQLVLNIMSLYGLKFESYFVGDKVTEDVHNACLELEKLGKIKRHLEEKDYIVWVPVEDEKC